MKTCKKYRKEIKSNIRAGKKTSFQPDARSFTFKFGFINNQDTYRPSQQPR